MSSEFLVEASSAPPTPRAARSTATHTPPTLPSDEAVLENAAEAKLLPSPKEA
jgi:hypothetical protein